MNLNHHCRPVLAGLLVVSLGAHSWSAETEKSLTLLEAMKVVVAPQTQVIWDITNAAQDDVGNVKADALKPGDWAKIANAARESRRALRNLLAQPRVIAAPTGKKIQDEGTAGAFGAHEVQQTIDGNPAAFAAFANQLAETMNGIVSAAGTRDAAKVGALAGQLDGVCEACHKAFWYPQQAARK